MKSPKPPAETPEQKQQRLRAENENMRAMQVQAQDRTTFFRRLRSPRLSIATNRPSPFSGGGMRR